MLPVISLERGTGLVVAPKKPFCSSCLEKTWELGKGTDRRPVTLPPNQCRSLGHGPGWSWPCTPVPWGAQGLQWGNALPRQSNALSTGPAAPPPAQRPLYKKWHFD